MWIFFITLNSFYLKCYDIILKKHQQVLSLISSACTSLYNDGSEVRTYIFVYTI